MKVTVQKKFDAIAILQIKGALTRSSAYLDLTACCSELKRTGTKAILIDLSACSRVNYAGLASLVELACTTTDLHVAYSGLNRQIERKLESSGLDRGLYIYDGVDDALKSSFFQSATLSHTKAVILCNETAESLPPLSHVVPAPMLDMFGRPLIERIRDHLAGFGIREVFANPGHLGDQIVEHFHGKTFETTSQRFSDERLPNSVSHHLGTAGSLCRIQQQQCAFDRDFFVLSGSALTNVNLADMMQFHRSQSADVTIAPSGRSGNCFSNSGLVLSANTGPYPSLLARQEVARGKTSKDGLVFIVSPDILDILPIARHWDLSRDLLPKLKSLGRKILKFTPDFDAIEVGAARDFSTLIIDLLYGKGPDFLQSMLEKERLGPTGAGQRSPQARVSQNMYIGSGAMVAADVELLGRCFIGNGAKILGPSVLEDCLVLPDTTIAPGFWGQNMTIHNDWAFDHRLEGHDASYVPFAQSPASDPPSFLQQRTA